MKNLFNPGDVVVVDFPGVSGIKRRPAVVLSSEVYHTSRPDIIVGLITSQTAAALGPTDYALQDWATAGLRVASAFRSFLVTLPPSANPVRIGCLSESDWQAVRVCVKTAFAQLD
ncbi:type II toxin-antitoxin system PemK/MazF family toxin [Tolypothrix campylonemoides VB511288]|nr:type II toxin-antitoxin system PemK/MazF family toxin [Tolypothrix campylonemoides VB511288]